MNTEIFDSLTLPNGMILKNRIAKAAMEESMSDADLLPGQDIIKTYRRWSDGGAGLLITGNVMVDKMAMTGPASIALEKDTDLTAFKRWAQEATRNDSKIYMQISHPGRQTPAALGGKALSASDVALDLGQHSSMFPKPRAMTETEIEDVIDRFFQTARQAKMAGFNGVQVHGAHGYLVNQFLSPLANKRNDQWGGSIENRARLLVTIARRIKDLTDADFGVAVKLNSADFQRGGFDIDDAKAVTKMLNEIGMDFIEISGGTYEAPAMQGVSKDDRTLAREAFFLEFAKDVAAISSDPIMTTGGITRPETAKEVLNQQVDIVGIGSALAVDPELPNKWQNNAANSVFAIPGITWKNKTLRALAHMALMRAYIHRGATGKGHRKLHPFLTFIFDQMRSKKMVKRYRKHHLTA